MGKVNNGLAYIVAILQCEDSPTVESTMVVALWGKDVGSKKVSRTPRTREIVCSSEIAAVEAACIASAVEEQADEKGVIYTENARGERFALDDSQIFWYHSTEVSHLWMDVESRC